jgi:hypothetical protein
MSDVQAVVGPYVTQSELEAAIVEYAGQAVDPAVAAAEAARDAAQLAETGAVDAKTDAEAARDIAVPAAQSAEDDAALAQAWAESPTAPGGAGTKSAKTHALDAGLSAAAAAVSESAAAASAAGAEADAIAILRLRNPNLAFAGFVVPSTPTPAFTANNAYVVAQTGTVFGLAVTKGQIIVDTGAAFTVTNAGAVDTFPFVEGQIPTGSASKLSYTQYRDFLQGVYLSGTRQTDKFYSVLSVARNLAGLWLVQIGYSNLDGTGIVQVAEFRATASPESGNAVTVHDLNLLTNDRVFGQIAVNWSAVPDGVNATVQTHALGYGLSTKVWNRDLAVGLLRDSRVLAKTDYVNRTAPFLTHDEVDKILLNVYLRNTVAGNRYCLFRVNKNVAGSYAIEIAQIDNAETITMVCRFITTTAQSGIKYHELASTSNELTTGNIVVNWDAIQEGVNYAFGTAGRYKGYLLKDTTYQDIGNDLEPRNRIYDTLDDAFIDRAQGVVYVGNMAFKPFAGAVTAKSDYLSMDRTSTISGYNYTYVDTQGARLMLIDRNSVMWWRRSVSGIGPTIFRCTVDAYKAALTPITAPAPFTGERWMQFDIGVLTTVQAINVFSMRETEGRLVAQSAVVSDPVGTYFYYNRTTDQFVASTIPSGGRQGQLREAWGYDAFESWVLTSGYNLTYGNGRVLLSTDYGVNYNGIFDIATTGVLTETERLTAHIHGCFIDRYNNKRIYVLLGDYSHTLPGTGKIIYSDNPTAVIPIWIKMPIAANEAPDLNEQHVSGYALPKCVLFGTDMNADGIYRMSRARKTFSKRERVLSFKPYTGVITYCPGSFNKRSHTDPLFFFNQTADVGGVPSEIWATFDGISFKMLWQDVVNHSPFSNIHTNIQHHQNDLYCMFQGGANDRFAAQTLLTMQLETA